MNAIIIIIIMSAIIIIIIITIIITISKPYLASLTHSSNPPTANMSEKHLE